MRSTARIADKLKKYESTGHYDGAIDDIYKLIRHIASLEEEVDDLWVEAREARAWERRYNELLELYEQTQQKPERKTNE
jgi:hypothetical protein